MSHMHGRNFGVVLAILRYIYHGKGSFDALADSVDMDKTTLKLWLQTLVAEGYLKKQASDEYVITEKGIMEVRFHAQT